MWAPQISDKQPASQAAGSSSRVGAGQSPCLFPFGQRQALDSGFNNENQRGQPACLAALPASPSGAQVRRATSVSCAQPRAVAGGQHGSPHRVVLWSSQRGTWVGLQGEAGAWLPVGLCLEASPAWVQPAHWPRTRLWACPQNLAQAMNTGETVQSARRGNVKRGVDMSFKKQQTYQKCTGELLSVSETRCLRLCSSARHERP